MKYIFILQEEYQITEIVHEIMYLSVIIIMLSFLRIVNIEIYDLDNFMYFFLNHCRLSIKH